MLELVGVLLRERFDRTVMWQEIVERSRDGSAKMYVNKNSSNESPTRPAPSLEEEGSSAPPVFQWNAAATQLVAPSAVVLN